MDKTLAINLNPNFCQFFNPQYTFYRNPVNTWIGDNRTIVDKPTCGQSSRRVVNLRTGQFVDWSSRGNV